MYNIQSVAQPVAQHHTCLCVMLTRVYTHGCIHMYLSMHMSIDDADTVHPCQCLVRLSTRMHMHMSMDMSIHIDTSVPTLLCMSVHMPCMPMHVCIHDYTHIYTNYLYSSHHTRLYTCSCRCLCTCLCTCPCTCSYTCQYTCPCTCPCTCPYICPCTCLMHAYTHVYTRVIAQRSPVDASARRLVLRNPFDKISTCVTAKIRFDGYS